MIQPATKVDSVRNLATKADLLTPPFCALFRTIGGFLGLFVRFSTHMPPQ